jgi:hypothetical protein
MHIDRDTLLELATSEDPGDRAFVVNHLGLGDGQISRISQLEPMKMSRELLNLIHTVFSTDVPGRVTRPTKAA